MTTIHPKRLVTKLHIEYRIQIVVWTQNQHVKSNLG